MLGDTDLVGHVAYALYKRDKLKFCEEEAMRTGTAATRDAIDAFIRVSNLGTRVDAYRREAEELLEEMTRLVLADAIKENKAEFKDELAEELRKPKSWGRIGLEAVIGSIAVAAAWALLIVVIYAGTIGPRKAMKDILHIDVQADVQPVTASPPASTASASH